MSLRIIAERCMNYHPHFTAASTLGGAVYGAFASTGNFSPYTDTDVVVVRTIAISGVFAIGGFLFGLTAPVTVPITVLSFPFILRNISERNRLREEEKIKGRIV